MNGIDYEYVARTLSRVSGIPVRVYKNGALICGAFPAELPRDPAERYKDRLFSINKHVGYFCTPDFHYYGVLCADDVRIVAGPTSEICDDDQKLKEIAFQSDVPSNDVGAFVEGMRAIKRIPVEKLLQILCSVNHFLNCGERLELSELSINESVQEEMKIRTEQKRTKRLYDEPSIRPHDTLNVEEAIMSIVRKGDSVALRRWLSSAPAVQGGALAGDQLRHLKNQFIVTATLVSRAAIHGGMDAGDALSLSDAYIQRSELLSDHDSIINLQYHMLVEFTGQVEKIRLGENASRLTADVANYVRHHLSETVSVDDMAREFFMSRPYLSAKFKKETGKTLTDFILNEKTEEAKRLLRYSDKSLSSISSYLGFSSQSHFIRVFRKYAGVTPGEYLEKHRK